MLPRLPFCLLISLPILLVQGSADNSSKKSPDAPTSPVPHPPLPPQGDPSWTLGLRLYRALRSDSSSGNILFSPLLVASSLGALGESSAGNTASQVRDLLKPQSPIKAGTQVAELLSKALKSFGEANGTSFHLRASSAVFSKQVPPVNQAFLKQSQTRFRVQHQTLGKGDTKADLKQLQDWAKAGLSGLEGAPLEAEIKAAAGALILANAVHFKGSEFEPSLGRCAVSVRGDGAAPQSHTQRSTDSVVQAAEVIRPPLVLRAYTVEKIVHHRDIVFNSMVATSGLWEREFSEDKADWRTFLGKKYTKVVMMHRAGLYRFYEDIDNMVQVLEAPLWGGKARVVLLLPFHVENLARLEKLLTLELLSKWLEKASVTSVAVSLPKANITSTLSLQKQLFALGLTDAWDQKLADFSGVSDKSKGKIHLGGVLHWASLELAAQAGKEDADLEEEHIDQSKLFYADHPFIIFVRDNTTGALLLMGALDHAEGEAIHDEL